MYLKISWDRVTSCSDSCVSNKRLFIVHTSIVFCIFFFSNHQFLHTLLSCGSRHPEKNAGFKVSPWKLMVLWNYCCFLKAVVEVLHKQSSALYQASRAFLKAAVEKGRFSLQSFIFKQELARLGSSLQTHKLFLVAAIRSLFLKHLLLNPNK